MTLWSSVSSFDSAGGRISLLGKNTQTHTHTHTQTIVQYTEENICTLLSHSHTHFHTYRQSKGMKKKKTCHTTKTVLSCTENAETPLCVFAINKQDGLMAVRITTVSSTVFNVLMSCLPGPAWTHAHTHTKCKNVVL